jgi:broad specificity phosphatase PhoE
LSNIYLVRHGQAGTRDEYDALSALGRRQARMLGEYFVSQGFEFASALVGSLERQRQTALEVARAYAEAGARFPEPVVEGGWDEFDLHGIYREFAPRLCEEDEEFRRDYEAMRAEVAASADDPGAEVHRRWRPCDSKIVESWIAGRYDYTGETWEQFRERVSACRVRADEAGAGDGRRSANVVVFTSATPAAIWAGRALGISDERVRAIAGVLRNSSYTVLHLRREGLRLFSFNEVPHLPSPELRTHR